MTAFRRCLALVAVLMILPGFGSGERFFAPGAELWDRWTRHDAASRLRVDHGAWDGLLRRHVRTDGPVNLVDYRALKADRAVLDGYIADLSATDVDALNRDEQMAFWINLYNALTVQVVIDHLPVDSIRDIDISPGVFATGPWGKDLVAVAGQPLGLNDIEHRILRPIWQDPRVHYALNCASIGCPDLAPRAYTGVGLDRALTLAATAYVNNPRGVTIRDGRVTVSRIYDWFIEDFGGSEATVLAHLKRYAEPDLKTRLDAAGGLDDTAYDWSLNDAR